MFSLTFPHTISYTRSAAISRDFVTCSRSFSRTLSSRRSVDGKHIYIQAPANSGSLNHNYKKRYSIVLLAACNHRYEFIICDVGAYGGESDGGVFARSEFGRKLEERTLDMVTEEAFLPNTTIKMPFYFVGDAGFKMTVNFMRPYPGHHLSEEKRIFNYRLSRARRCIENAFGILVARWRVFSKEIAFEPQHVDKLVLAAVSLHNFLMARTQKDVRNMYCSPNFVDKDAYGNVIQGSWRHEIGNENISRDCRLLSARQMTLAAHTMRDKLAKYFMSPEGEVSWQKEYIQRGRYQDI